MELIDPDIKEKLKDLSNWTEVVKGFYRYEIEDGTYLEILLTHYADETDILQARAMLLASGRWDSRGYVSDESYFWRNCDFEGTVQDCLNEALRFAPGI